MPRDVALHSRVSVTRGPKSCAARTMQLGEQRFTAPLLAFARSRLVCIRQEKTPLRLARRAKREAAIILSRGYLPHRTDIELEIRSSVRLADRESGEADVGVMPSGSATRVKAALADANGEQLRRFLSADAKRAHGLVTRAGVSSPRVDRRYRKQCEIRNIARGQCGVSDGRNACDHHVGWRRCKTIGFAHGLKAARLSRSKRIR
jgi:hypothetical protein